MQLRILSLIVTLLVVSSVNAGGLQDTGLEKFTCVAVGAKTPPSMYADILHTAIIYSLNKEDATSNFAAVWLTDNEKHEPVVKGGDPNRVVIGVQCLPN